MNLPEGTHLAYNIRHEAWAWDAARVSYDNRPGIAIGAAFDDGVTCAWEFSIEERDLGRLLPALQLHMFDEGWVALVQVPELFAGLAALGSDPTLTDVRVLLDRLGALDETERVEPEATREDTPS